MKISNDVKKQLVVLPLSLLASILSGFIPKWTGSTFTSAEQILLRIGIFIVFLLLDIIWIVAHHAARQTKEYELWSLRASGDWELTNIRTCFLQITQDSYGKRDLFVTHFMRKFQELSRDIKEVAERQELRVTANHFLGVDNVLEAFQGDEERIWRYIWPINAHEKLFEDLAWKRYFEMTTKMVHQKKIKCVRAILIFDGLELMNTPRIKKLLDFFKKNKDMECCIVRCSDYKAICTDNGIPSNYLDFGIYGDSLLFLTEQYIPEIIGLFTKDNGLIRHYKDIFDTMWNSSSVSRKNPSQEKGIVTIEELFAFDEEQNVASIMAPVTAVASMQDKPTSMP